MMNLQDAIDENGMIKTGAMIYVEHYDAFDNLISREEKHNLAPTEALVYEAGLIAGKTTQITSWYIALYSGNYSPVATDTCATFAANATEFTGYSEATRQLWVVPSSITTNTADNVGNEAVFTATSAGTIYGCAILSIQAKGSSSAGILLSEIKFPSSKPMSVGDKIKIGAGLTVISQ